MRQLHYSYDLYITWLGAASRLEHLSTSVRRMAEKLERFEVGRDPLTFYLFLLYF